MKNPSLKEKEPYCLDWKHSIPRIPRMTRVVPAFQDLNLAPAYPDHEHRGTTASVCNGEGLRGRGGMMTVLKLSGVPAHGTTRRRSAIFVSVRHLNSRCRERRTGGISVLVMLPDLRHSVTGAPCYTSAGIVSRLVSYVDAIKCRSFHLQPLQFFAMGHDPVLEMRGGAALLRDDVP